MFFLEISFRCFYACACLDWLFCTSPFALPFGHSFIHSSVCMLPNLWTSFSTLFHRDVLYSRSYWHIC